MNLDNDSIQTPIVSCQWLKKHIHDDDVRVVDASWHMPATERDARAEFKQKHIPGAVFFNIDEHSTPGKLPHMLPCAEQFARAVSQLGIATHHTIVIYDTLGLFSAARVWWMFRHFGTRQVHVLDGGLPAWERSGGSLASLSTSASAAGDSSPRVEPARFVVESEEAQRESEVVDADDVLAAIDVTSVITLDARSRERFTAEVKETRQGLRSGHIPGSVSLPFTSVLDENGMLKDKQALIAIFEKLQLTPEMRIMTTCGSGVTAAILCLALHSVGFTNVALYDGSWTEWGSLDHVPVATG